jgi:hypothetical protein
LLLAFDRDLADIARSEGCAMCSGRLHSASFPRKPRGRPCRLGPEHDQRFSFCCAADGCRSRATPPSLRFLGRKVYLAAIVVLISIMRHGATEWRTRQLTEAVGVDAGRSPVGGRGGATASRRARSGGLLAPRSCRPSIKTVCRRR